MSAEIGECADCGRTAALVHEVPSVDGGGSSEWLCGNCPPEVYAARLRAMADEAAAQDAEDAAMADAEADQAAAALASLSGLGAPLAGAGVAPPRSGPGVLPEYMRRAATRNKEDLYLTPPGVVTAILPFIPPGVKILYEPCYGKGNIADVLAAVPGDGGAKKYNVLGTDLHQPAPQGTGVNFLDKATIPPGLEYDMIITNPPWSEKAKWLKALADTGKPFLVLYPMSVLSGVETSDILAGGHRFFLLPSHVRL